jgi:hypothetical protein
MARNRQPGPSADMKFYFPDDIPDKAAPGKATKPTRSKRPPQLRVGKREKPTTSNRPPQTRVRTPTKAATSNRPPQTRVGKREKPTTSNRPPQTRVGKPERITVLISAAIISRARDACYWTPGQTMAGLVAVALDAEVTRMEKKRKAPFPPRKGKLRTGRPPSK